MSRESLVSGVPLESNRHCACACEIDKGGENGMMGEREREVGKRMHESEGKRKKEEMKVKPLVCLNR